MLPAGGEDLSHALHLALDRSDTSVLLVEWRAGVLSIVAANRQAERSTGFGAGELVGRPVASLAAPDSDPAALHAILAAVREARVHHAQLRCRTRSGQAVWFELNLMPADQADGAPRSIILGRDVTARLREHEQDLAVQALLAKVFMTVDLPVYILDLQGRFVMTNPAFDRLLGVQPGSLTGERALDRYAPGCHAAIAAKRRQQDADGLDYAVDVTLRTAAGDRPARIAGVMVQRPDLLRFRIVTVHAGPPAPRVTAAGRIRLLGLADLRDALGARWPEVADRAMATAEHVLRRRLGPAETFSRTPDQGFIVCFTDTSADEAAFRAAAIGREIRTRLIGEGETPEAAHVAAMAAELPAAILTAPADDLAALALDRLDSQLDALQATARDQLRQALHTLAPETDSVRSRHREDTVGHLVRLPRAADHAIAVALGVLPAAETQSLDSDGMVIGLARVCAIDTALRGCGKLVFVTLGPDVLLLRARMDMCVEACRAIEDAVRHRLVLILSLPPGLPAVKLEAGLARLRPFSRSIGVAVDPWEAEPPDVATHHLGIVMVDAARCMAAPPWAPKLRTLAARLHAHRCHLMVGGVASPRDVAELFAGGAEFVSVAGRAA